MMKSLVRNEIKIDQPPPQDWVWSMLNPAWIHGKQNQTSFKTVYSICPFADSFIDIKVIRVQLANKRRLLNVNVDFPA
jgi:hypothetical protein